MGGSGHGVFASASQFVILEDGTGSVPCVIKSLRTHDCPSAVVYAPKPRYAGQVPSGHRLTRRRNGYGYGVGCGFERRRGMGVGNAAAVIDDDREDDVNGGGSEALYPWALVSKRGRGMEDECAVHLVNDEGRKGKKGGRGGFSSSSTTTNHNNGGSIFNSEPSFRGRHGFDDRGLQTHTVVSRTTTTTAGAASSSTVSSLHCAEKTNSKKSNTSAYGRTKGGESDSCKNDNNSTSLEEVPCCLIIRDPSDFDAVDLTIAPGIDPLLMICYLACHSKMDLECIMSGY